jgi:putative addiction module component (TIGR02574 family)
MSADELLAKVLSLPREERARLAEELLSSLEEPDDEEVLASWAAELERRAAEIGEGKVQTVEWGAACQEISRELEARRARRAAS